MNCTMVDELAAAYGLDAVDVDEEREIAAHLDTCAEPHEEARGLIAAAISLGESAEPIEPSARLRARLMTTIAETPQEHRAPRRDVASQPTAGSDRRPWWRLAPMSAGLAAVALAAAVGLGAWGLGLDGRLADREAVLRAVAQADAAHPVSGSVGSGWLLQDGDEAIFLAADLDELPADRIYELWLIDADGVPTAAGVVADASGLTVITLERSLASAEVFAVTIEEDRVDAPTGDPVLVASLATP